LGMGVESVWQPSLDIINKRISVQKARDTISLLKANDIEAKLYLIIGLPGEPENIVDLTWDFIEETQPDLVHLSLFTVRPGTEVYRNPTRFGIKNTTSNWSNTMHIHGLDENRPELTFEYNQNTPWGRSLTNDQIIDNYFELLRRLKRSGLSSSEINKNTFPFDDINPLV